MLFILKLVIVCSYCFITCQSAIILYPASVHPAHPYSCWDEMNGIPVPVGGSWQEPICVRASCYLYKRKLYVEWATCGMINVPSNCIVIEDLTMEYPLCCPHLYCANDDDPRNFLGQDYDDFKEWLQNTYYDTDISYS